MARVLCDKRPVITKILHLSVYGIYRSNHSRLYVALSKKPNFSGVFAWPKIGPFYHQNTELECRDLH